MKREEDIQHLYRAYNTVIKPLIAEVEARTEQFPLPLFNEIRALHDHISRCYCDGVTEEQIEKNIEKGERHVVRIILDCYKYLNLSLHDSLMLFERQTRNIDLTVLKNGTFYPEYKSLRTKAVQMVRKAKTLESSSNPQPIGFSGILLAKRQNSFYCTYFLHNRNVADTKSPYPIKRLEVIRWFNQKSMVFNQSLS